jgi:hypothetical protein
MRNQTGPSPLGTVSSREGPPVSTGGPFSLLPSRRRQDAAFLAIPAGSFPRLRRSMHPWVRERRRNGASVDDFPGLIAVNEEADRQAYARRQEWLAEEERRRRGRPQAVRKVGR